jgi:hypothetical protein
LNKYENAPYAIAKGAFLFYGFCVWTNKKRQELSSLAVTSFLLDANSPGTYLVTTSPVEN